MRVGDSVHYVDEHARRCIAAIVVRVWAPDLVNLMLIPDGTNDGYSNSQLVWKTSRRRSGKDRLPGTWHALHKGE